MSPIIINPVRFEERVWVKHNAEPKFVDKRSIKKARLRKHFDM